MFEWLTDTVNNVIEFFTGGSDDDNDEPNPCDVGDCLAALDELDAARSDTERACFWLKLVLVPLRTAIFIVSRSLVEYIVILVIVFLLFFIAGIVIAVAFFLFTLLFIRAWVPVIRVAANNLAIAFENEVNAIGRVQAECPEECQGDLTPSQCDLGEGNVLPENPVPVWPAIGSWLGLDELNRVLGRR